MSHTSGSPAELVLSGRDQLERHSFPIRESEGGFEARVAAGKVPSLGGELPLRADDWDMHVRLEGDEEPLPLLVSQGLYGRLPLENSVGHKQLALGITGDQRALLAVQRDLDDDERGPFHQRRLRESVYAARRGDPLRDAVVYASFGGRQYSDSPRAIYEELVRREAALEHQWVVRDGMCRVPPDVNILREGSREYHEALARARFVVTNDRLPEWFARRADQTYVQTSQHPAEGAQYAVSPNRVSTAALRKRFGGEVLETGLPRVDVFFRPDRDELARTLRERLAVPAGRRVVLYAPRYREHVVDSQGRHRLDLHLDLERLSAAVGDDTVILFRKDHRITDAVPATRDGFLRDVSSYPDATELLLAADVLVTDYASLMFDFANTGRPMLFFAYDLDAHRDSLSFDYEHTVPGPVVRTTEELAVALADVHSVAAEYADRYREFVATFCEFDDGHAAARVVDRVFRD